MGIRLHDDELTAGKTYKESLYKLGQLFVDRLSTPYLICDWLFNFMSIGRETKKLLKTVKAFTRNVIMERKKNIALYGSDFEKENDENLTMQSKKKKIAMLDLLIAAQKEGVINDKGIQEEVDTFMFEVRVCVTHSKQILEMLVIDLCTGFFTTKRCVICYIQVVPDRV